MPSTTSSRPFAQEHLSDLLAFVSIDAGARIPGAPYLMTNDVAWRLPGSTPERNLRLWYDDAGLAGYAWFEPEAGDASFALSGRNYP